MVGTCDPYVVLTYGGVEKKTTVKKKMLDATFNERFSISTPIGSQTGDLEVMCMDWDMMKGDDVIGRGVVKAGDLRTLPQGGKRVQLQLMDDRGLFVKGQDKCVSVVELVVRRSGSVENSPEPSPRETGGGNAGNEASKRSPSPEGGAKRASSSEGHKRASSSEGEKRAASSSTAHGGVERTASAEGRQGAASAEGFKRAASSEGTNRVPSPEWAKRTPSPELTKTNVGYRALSPEGSRRRAMSNESGQRRGRVEMEREEFEVLVVSAKHLPKTDMVGTCDPYVVL
eukprot:1375818-Rhodomonas_salina.1